MPTGKQDSAFASMITEEDLVKTDITVSKTALDQVIWWIAKNLTPDEVFEEKVLSKFAGDNFSIDDVFSEKELREWAESNGYVKQ